jgi:nucleoid-associated protein YejK
MFKINHAILHVFDFVSCANVYSQNELDLSNKNVKKYVSGVAKHALGGIDNKRGVFEPDSGFKGELLAYLNGQNNFIDLSMQIAEFLGSELGRVEHPVSADLLVVDFEDSPKAPKVSEEEAAELSEEELAAAQAALDAAYAGRSAHYFGLLLLESKQAFMHEVGRSDDGNTVSSIERHHAILPSPSQKIASFALIDCRSMAVQFVDKQRTIAGEDRWLIPQGLLQCTMEASSKELIDTTMRLVEEVATEYGANPAVATARAKAYVAENADDSDEVPFDELAEEVFHDEAPRRRFTEAAEEEDLPRRAPVEREVAKRVTRNHKIRTDTGIEITFPAEYAQNPEFIEFTSADNGLIQIELKNIGSIENR